MATMPMDIIHDLFLRLSAATLVRFRLLSKPCLSLIDDPDFISSHLNRTLETGDHLMLLLRGPRILRTVDLDATDNVSVVEHPLSSGGFADVFGSCNGLIGLANSPTDMAIFNPSTRKIHRLPSDSMDFAGNCVNLEYVMYGLGYDSASNDYKVVRIIQCKGDKGDSLHARAYEIKIFSLKRNSWKRVDYLPLESIMLFRLYYHLAYRQGNGILANNCLHWVLPRRQGAIAINTLLRFDLASEEIDNVYIPKELWYEVIDVGVLDGCLCLMSIHEFSHVDVWIMRKYKRDGTWTKLFRVPKPESVESFELMKPLLYSKDRRQVLLEINDARNLMWFDLESKRFTEVEIKGCDNPYSVELLVSSLVMGCKGDPNRVKRRKEQQHKSNKRDGFLSKGFNLKL